MASNQNIDQAPTETPGCRGGAAQGASQTPKHTGPRPRPAAQLCAPSTSCRGPATFSSQLRAGLEEGKETETQGRGVTCPAELGLPGPPGQGLGAAQEAWPSRCTLEWAQSPPGEGWPSWGPSGGPARSGPRSSKERLKCRPKTSRSRPDRDPGRGVPCTGQSGPGGRVQQHRGASPSLCGSFGLCSQQGRPDGEQREAWWTGRKRRP